MNGSHVLGPNEAERIVTTLVSHGVKFVICGGAACMLHGMDGRVTGDMDIRVKMDTENLRCLVAAIKELGLAPRIPEPLDAIADPNRRRTWIEEKRAVVSTYSSPQFALQLDVFLEYPLSFEELADQADRMKRGSVEFLVSSKQHLIYAKQQVKPLRKIDERDIADLKEMISREQRK